MNKKLRGLLAKLAEESGEVVQASMKVQQGSGSIRALEDEVGDLLAGINVLCASGLVDAARITARSKRKVRCYARWFLGERA